MIDFRTLMIKESYPSFTSYKTIQAGNYKISIQASSYHYSNPRINSGDLYVYESMEIALFDLNDKWVIPSEDEYILKFDRIEELIYCYEDGDCPVGAYVPVKLIQSLFDYLSGYEEEKLSPWEWMKNGGTK